MKRFKRMLLTSALALGLITPLAVPAVSYAQTDDISQPLCAGANLNVNETSCPIDDTTAGTKVNDTIKFIINIFSFVVGAVAVIMIIVGGFRYITSGGDSGNVTAAKNTILYAIVGLVIVALAQVIVRFVLGKTESVAGSP